ncbi:MAG: DUF1727 domain-containing protein [Ruminococcaceae bacterium]|nr:DUF1727 domain-containing protein [Oscillospiraceae bacterium]
MFLKRFIAILFAKLSIILGRMLGKKSSSTPGTIAMKICPDILFYLAKQVKKEIIFICGTNGKTTTSNLLYSLIKSEGKKVVCNNVGANMLPGVACAFVSSANVFGKINADYAVIECDEASIRHIVKHVIPNKIVLTNLFRDQLDRYGEIDTTIKLLEEAFEKIKDVNLIVNGDDPLCAYFGTKYNTIYFGVDEESNLNTNETKEGRFCLECGGEIKYNYYHYSQLGDYYCEKCGFKRPSLNYFAKNVDLSDGMKFDLYFKDKVINLSLDYKGFYNIYNILASFSAFESLNLGYNNLNNVLKNYKPQIGRMETFNINGKKVILNLSKNPAGFNQAIATLNADQNEKDVFVVINDKAQDGTDISWIWDVDFELFEKCNIKNIYVGGMRKDDLALRLKYANLGNIEVIENNIKNLSHIISKNDLPIYLLVNYTALFSTQSDLLTLEKGGLKN